VSPASGGRYAYTQPAAGGVIASDSFDRANSTTTMGDTDSYAGGTTKTWSPTQGTWGILSNKGYSASNGDDDRTVIDAGVGAHAIEADITVDPGGAARALGLVAQWSSGTNHYLANRGNAASGSTTLFKRTGGGYSQIATTTSSGNCTLKLAVAASSQIISVNGVAVITQTDSAVAAGTSCGFRIGAAASAGDHNYNNLIVTPS
jgi:hypothetical protein